MDGEGNEPLEDVGDVWGCISPFGNEQFVFSQVGGDVGEEVIEVSFLPRWAEVAWAVAQLRARIDGDADEHQAANVS